MRLPEFAKDLLVSLLGQDVMVAVTLIGVAVIWWIVRKSKWTTASRIYATVGVICLTLFVDYTAWSFKKNEDLVKIDTSRLCFHEKLKVLEEKPIEPPLDSPVGLHTGYAKEVTLQSPVETSNPSYIRIYTDYLSIEWATVGIGTQGGTHIFRQPMVDFTIQSPMGPHRTTTVILLSTAPFKVLCADKFPIGTQ